ncbi:MAG: beta-galactosidase [Planctomycetes bacterium]|nr:beta-galactosidase [Planctomycetota bacterium]
MSRFVSLLPLAICCLSQALLSAEAVKTVEIGAQRELRVNGQPYFPIMSWAQATSRFQKLKDLGFNTFCGSGKTAKEALEAAQAAGGLALVHASAFDSGIKGHPALLGYALRDEPDMGIGKGKPKVAVEEIAGWYKTIREQDPSRPVFLNFTADFMQEFFGKKPDVQAYYAAAAKSADILCFDIYPIYQQNRDDRLIWVAEGVSELRALGGTAKPVWAWIETSKGSKWITYERQKDVTPEITRAEVWMAVIRGATGIGYFTHAWRPSFNEFAPGDAMQAELKRTNEQLGRLGPVLLSDPVARKASIAFDSKQPGEILLREHGGWVYLFANNLDMQDLGARKDDVKAAYRAGSATLSVEGLAAGTNIEVLDENRSIQAQAGAFKDDFKPLEVHLYRFKRP